MVLVLEVLLIKLPQLFHFPDGIFEGSKFVLAVFRRSLQRQLLLELLSVVGVYLLLHCVNYLIIFFIFLTKLYDFFFQYLTLFISFLRMRIKLLFARDLDLIIRLQRHWHFTLRRHIH